jgi:hypothetical protein
MATAAYPPVSTAATLRHTITSVGTTSVTIPSTTGLVYVRLGSSTTNGFVEGWVTAPANGIINASYTSCSQLWYQGQTNIYIYY